MPPPPPPASPALGSRRTFYVLFSIIGLAAVGWPWRGAVFEDWLAGAVFLSAFPGLLTLGERRAAWRKAAGVALFLGGISCFARYVHLGTAASPSIETMIAAALGAICAGGAVYLGFWGTDREELFWSRLLFCAGGPLLALAALTWALPESQGWIGGLGAAAPRAWGVWWAAGGAWRWGGLALVSGAAAAARGLKTVSTAAPTDRKLNWNK